MKHSFGLKVFLISAMAALILLFFMLDLDRYVSFDYLKNALDGVKGYSGQNRALTMAAYMGIYIFATALSLPGAAVMTLAGGALFGFFTEPSWFPLPHPGRHPGLSFFPVCVQGPGSEKTGAKTCRHQQGH